MITMSARLNPPNMTTPVLSRKNHVKRRRRTAGNISPATPVTPPSLTSTPTTPITPSSGSLSPCQKKACVNYGSPLLLNETHQKTPERKQDKQQQVYARTETP